MKRHAIADERWPTAAEAAAARLFSPVRLGGRVARNRTWVPAMVPWRATEDGVVTPALLDWYGRLADGRPGVLVVEATGIRDVPSGPLLRIGDDRFIAGLRALTNVVRARSGGETLVFIQLIDFLAVRRRPDPARFFAQFLAITDGHRRALGVADDAAARRALAALPAEEQRALLTAREWEALTMGWRERVTDVEAPHIRDLPQTLPPLFAEAAARAQAAGFDGVELHAAHAYTLASFLSALNTRNDGFGGARADRQRVPVAALRAARAATGDFVIGARFLSEEAVAGGNSADDAAHFALAFADAGADYLSLSQGGKFEDAAQPRVGEAAYPYTGPSGEACMPTVFAADAGGPFGRQLPAAATVRAAVRAAGFDTPVVAAGGITSFSLAEAALARGDCDVIASARQSLADPDWFTKVRLGRGGEVRRCQLTNYCEALDQRHRPVTCQLWDHPQGPDGPRLTVAPAWVR